MSRVSSILTRLRQILMENLYRKIPQLNELINDDKFKELSKLYSHACLVDTCRNELDNIRQKISAQIINEQNFDKHILNIFNLVQNRLESIFKPTPCGVINATGTILHTNLGRSPLSNWQLSGLSEISNSYCNLEFNLDDGKRGSRQNHINNLLCKIVGSEENVVVNNNAAAVLLVLCSLGAGSEVIISRGELVEIGGKFRIPDVLAQSGCKLVEVGTTNKTRIEDYENAITDKTSAIIKIHTSNFKVVGFTEDVDSSDLCKLAHKYGLKMIEDLGSGLLVDLKRFGIDEPTVQRSLNVGVDVVCYSGDKLLGGPQAGIISGRRELIETIKSNQLMRALRIGKLELSVLHQTLLLYTDSKRALNEVPVLNMITQSAEISHKKARQVFLLSGHLNQYMQIVNTESCIGGGSVPGFTLNSYAIALCVPGVPANELLQKLRLDSNHVIGVIREGRVLLDMCCVFESQISPLTNTLCHVIEEFINA